MACLVWWRFAWLMNLIECLQSYSINPAINKPSRKSATTYSLNQSTNCGLNWLNWTQAAGLVVDYAAIWIGLLVDSVAVVWIEFIEANFLASLNEIKQLNWIQQSKQPIRKLETECNSWISIAEINLISGFQSALDSFMKSRNFIHSCLMIPAKFKSNKPAANSLISIVDWRHSIRNLIQLNAAWFKFDWTDLAEILLMTWT